MMEKEISQGISQGSALEDQVTSTISMHVEKHFGSTWVLSIFFDVATFECKWQGGGGDDEM